jgi:hypothetical protein
MDIHVQSTPNPNALKFILPEVQFDRPLSFPSAEAAADHPLARRIFALGRVYNVFMVRDFVTVNKLPDIPWEPLRDEIAAVLVAYFEKIEG